MGKYSVPAEIRACKPKGSMVKCIGGRYYVYECSYSKVWVEDDEGNKRRKSVTNMGKCIGSITLKDGFIPNNNKLSTNTITCINYADYAFVIQSSERTLNLLKKHFNINDANQIYVVAIIFFIEKFTHMKKVKCKYDFSYLSIAFPDASTGYDAIESLYSNLGSRTIPVENFEQGLFDDSSGRVAIDGHVIACTSEHNDLSEYGYKASKIGTAQINWMNAYDVVTKKPLLSHFCNGSDPDKTSVRELFEKYELTNTEFCVDRGFNTKADKKLMSENGNSYIVPMISGRKDYEEVYSHMYFSKRNTFVYDKDGYSSLVYFHVFSGDGIKRIAYKDTTRQSAERKTYIEKMKKGKKGFTKEGLAENEDNFGLFILETCNVSLTPEEVFSHYKERWTIETYYNYVKNDLDFNALYQQKYSCLMGLGFIVTITGLIYYDIKEAVKDSGMKVKDVMESLGKIKACLQGGKWRVHNTIKNSRDVCEKIGFELTESISQLQM